MPIIFTQPALPLGWDLEDAAYDSKSFDISGSLNNQPGGLYFSSDGFKMYVAGQTFSNGNVVEYDLSTAWDVSTSSSPALFSVNTQTSNPSGLTFKPDGTKMYVAAEVDDAVFQYDLSTAWDLSSAAYASKSFSVVATTGGVNGIQFKPDGTECYYTEYGVDAQVRTFSLSTPWDASTATDASTVFDFGAVTDPMDLFFRDNGSRMFIPFLTSGRIKQYDLGTNWDVSSAVFNSVEYITSAQTTKIRGFAFKTDDGKKMYVSTSDTVETVYQYSTL
jgi:DNA-binding beta-propeller fold protein YncE